MKTHSFTPFFTSLGFSLLLAFAGCLFHSQPF